MNNINPNNYDGARSFIVGRAGGEPVTKDFPNGGRVTELSLRPILNLFFPELSGMVQPLSGEQGGRRATLE